MSSILKALKKVEMESATQAGSTMPWSAPSSATYSSKSGARRWWILSGFIAMIVALGFVYWQIKWAGPRNGSEIAVPTPAKNTLAKGPHPDAGTPEKNESPQALPFAMPTVDADSTMVSKPKQKDGHFAAIVPETIPQQGVLEDTETKSSAVTPMTLASDLPGSRAEASYEKKGEPLENTKGAFQKSENKGVEENAVDGKITEKPEEKTYREDPRITLQAVVWAPEPESRFVMINNQMIREGGSVANIVVEKINPDDVLLSEGANRWYVEFTIR